MRVNYAIEVNRDRKSRKVKTRQQHWEEQYIKKRYMEFLSSTELVERAGHIFANICYINSDGRVALHHPKESGEYWLIRWTHLLQEFGLRGQGLDPSLAHTCDFLKPENELIKRAVTRSQKSSIGNPRAIYKFGHAEHMKDLFESGRMRVAPASSYSDRSLNSARQDDELSRHFKLRADEATLKTLDGREIEACGYIDVAYSFPTDYYIFCLSGNYSHRLFSDFEADAVVIIHNPFKFFEVLSSALKPNLPISKYQFRCVRVEYIDPLNMHPDHRDPPFTKHFKYAYQEELRLIWIPTSPVESLDVQFFNIGPMKEYATIIEI